MKDEQIEAIYKNFAEFHFQLHMEEIKTTFLPKVIQDAAAEGFKRHYKAYRQELSEKLKQLSERDLITSLELEKIRREYLRKFEARIMLN